MKTISSAVSQPILKCSSWIISQKNVFTLDVLNAKTTDKDFYLDLDHNSEQIKTFVSFKKCW